MKGFDSNLRPKQDDHWWEQDPIPQFSRNGEVAPFPRLVAPKRRRKLRRHVPFLRLVLPYLVVIAAVAAAFFYWRSLLHAPTTKGMIGFIGPADISPILPGIELASEGHVIHKVRSGETVESLSRRFGFSEELTKELQESIPAQQEQAFSLTAGKALDFHFREQKLEQIRTEPQPGSEIVIRRDENGKFVASKLQMPRLVQDRFAIGEIRTSFAAAAAKTGVQYDIIDELVDLFSDRVVFQKDFQPGDRFSLIYRDRFLADGTSIGPSQILAAALEVKGQRLVAIRYVGTDGKARYFDNKGELLGETFLRYPLKFSRISSYFSTARFHPVLKRSRPHNGVDFAARVGTPVRSIAAGRVVEAGWKGPNGIMVKVAHNDRFTTIYLHLSKLAPGIRANTRITRGQVIGAVGATGLATGPHLHFGFFDRGHYVDPLKMKLPAVEDLHRGLKIDTAYLQRVLFTLDHYQTMNLDDLYWKSTAS